LEFKVPFQHIYGYIRDKRSGVEWRVILTQGRKAGNILTSTLATFLLSSHPKRERDGKAHLNYYADNYHTTRQNKIKYNKRKARIFNKKYRSTQKTKLRFARLLRPRKHTGNKINGAQLDTSSGELLETAEKFCYLSDMLEADREKHPHR